MKKSKKVTTTIPLGLWKRATSEEISWSKALIRGLLFEVGKNPVGDKPSPTEKEIPEEENFEEETPEEVEKEINEGDEQTCCPMCKKVFENESDRKLVYEGLYVCKKCYKNNF